ncbi:serine/threonine protein kinase [Streptomyces amritsarensis]|uniref:Serine/threonine protein kinase n=1 Tax=Streptomyces amritsarensis TaxID=681158 RepID=A0ABX3G1M2_9ACTN|nr:serine/threonine-protein kinase [Streptomyces amritsarensis]OLZ65666.1 serine/threonine protein kinase [Streptomyces amritsarensis]
MNSATEVFQPLRADDPRTVGGYRLAARLGSGGMGRVYLSHTPGGRPVAIKVVHPELAEDATFRRRFRREVEAARRVRGAYTAELIDADAEATPPWLATVYVPGPSLSEAVARRGPLPDAAVVWLVAGVAEALVAVHGAGIVHRDLKPSNVLLAADGPRVIDFGISQASGLTATATGNTIGTPQYMAPEQGLAGETTPATDVFALGQTAAFAALGKPLYGDGPSMTVLFRIVHSKPDLTRLPEPLRPLFALCLATEPEERATPAEILAWCLEYLGEEAAAGGGPAVWREVSGLEEEIPTPVARPAASGTTQEDAPPGGTTPQGTPPGDAAPGGEAHATAAPAGAAAASSATPAASAAAAAEPGRRRTARVATVAAVTAALTLGGLGWKLMEGADGATERETAAARSSGPTPTTGSAPTPTPTPTPSAVQPPRPVPYPGLELNENNSISIKEPVQHDDGDRSGDIRMECGLASGCTMKSDAVVFSLPEKAGTGNLETCREKLAFARQNKLTLHVLAVGSEVCMKHPSGDIALFVIGIKSAPGQSKQPSWVRADMTVWRAAA